MIGEILFLAHRLPFPPDRGDKIRSHHILRALAKLAPVHVACLSDSRADFAHTRHLAELAASWCMKPRPQSLALAGIEALRRREPVSVAAFRNLELMHWVRSTLAARPIGAIYVFSGQMGQYVPEEWAGRLVVDLVDVDSAKFEAYATERSGPRRWIDAREARLLRVMEAGLAAGASTTLLVSEAEASLLRSRMNGAQDIRALGNGIDCTHFDPQQVAPSAQVAASPGPHFVFTGQMDYAPNIAAVRRFARATLPLLRTEHPDAAFHIVGRAPVPEVKALGALPSVRVWGEVPDTRPFLAAADIVVAPLSIARGVQNKVLEAMAMGKCVLLSPEAATGIDARPGEHFEVAADEAQFASRAMYLLDNPDARHRMGLAAQAFVRDTMSWSAMLADLPEIMGLAPADNARRDAA